MLQGTNNKKTEKPKSLNPSLEPCLCGAHTEPESADQCPPGGFYKGLGFGASGCGLRVFADVIKALGLDLRVWGFGAGCRAFKA